MNPFTILENVRDDYLTYVQTFQRFQNPRIHDWVMDRIQHGTLLWKPPYIQLSRPFAPGDTLESLIDAGLLHPGILPVFRRNPDDPTSPPIRPYKHQTDAIRAIFAQSSPSPEVGGGGQGEGANIVVATGTGSGKSFCFGIPIVSEALRMREQGIAGIKAVIVYPMNALANSQYDDFARRLHGTGLTIARYTGDTLDNPEEALAEYRRATGRQEPYDSEVLSRKDIQTDPPDILMTNYVMLELLLTRFEDRKLFARPGVLRFLVLDEVHTYTGKRGADVAALIRRLKQHTNTIGQLRCIATSATVESGGDVSAAEAVASFAQELFGEPFVAGNGLQPQAVITESYAPLPDDLPPLTRAIAEALAAGPCPLHELAEELDVTPEQIQDALLQPVPAEPAVPDAPDSRHPVPKVHAFFSQGRSIAACLDPTDPHLNDRGERRCPICAAEGRERATFPQVFCRACGQEYWSVSVSDDGRLHPAELDAVDVPGRLGYLLLGQPDIELPDNWLTPTGQVRGGKKGYTDVIPEPHTVCPDCATLLPNTQYPVSNSQSACAHPHAFPATLLPSPFLLCPTCGIVHDRRPREYNKLFTFGSVGRSTATDVLVSAQVQSLPEGGRKIIAFSDNRQDTALQAAHMTSLRNRIAFRQALYTTLRESHATVDSGEWLDLPTVGLRIFDTQRRHDVQPVFRKDQRAYGRDRQAEQRYRRYLEFVTLRELSGTHRRTHQNLEDVGLLAVTYNGLSQCAADEAFWDDVPVLCDLNADIRYDLLLGFLDLMRKRLAVAHEAVLRPDVFHTEVLSRLSEAAFVHDETFDGPIGYSDSAERGWGYTVYRFTGSNTQPVVWARRALGVDHSQAVEVVERIVEKLGDPTAAFIVPHEVRHYRRRFDLWMVNPEVITLQADPVEEQWLCPRCLTVHRFRTLRACTGSTCRTSLERRDLGENYFRQVYALPLGEAVPVRADEHSGQVSGQERRDIELRFRDPEDPLNVLICTPTMELGIDIGHLNAVMLRNVPPSPSNYAQRAGRAGRSGQPALITVFAGVGAARGPHDQYFYRFPEKMIAGAIAAPRFRLDNQALIRAHVHALVLETLGLKGAGRLPGNPQDLLDLDQPQFPLYADWKADYQAAIDAHFDDIVAAVEEAFTEEIERFDWFNRAFVEREVHDFVEMLDQAMDRWRDEYIRLDAEREQINRQLGREGVQPGLDRRRVVIESKLQSMREGRDDWYLYRYLGGEGFLPGYAFPPQATVLAFSDREDELARDPVIALTEYAPGNFVYYRSQRYEITHARPRTRQPVHAEGEPQTAIEVIQVLVCPTCGRAYVGAEETNRAACVCGQDLRAVSPREGMPLSDMFAQRRARITADEEERLRRGYEVTEHYMAGGRQETRLCRSGLIPDGHVAFRLTLEHDGQVLLLNRGIREQDDEPRGFALCTKCYAWLLGDDDAVNKHVETPEQPGDCPRKARRPEDLLRRLWLIQQIRSDLVLLDVPLPADAEGQADEFYTTLLHTWLRALLVAFNLDESEVAGFLAPSPDADDGVPYRIVLYETTVGGSGVLASLAEEGRLARVVTRAREILHEGDPEGGCERACYACLLSFYNQRDHSLLDRSVVLPWFQSLQDLTVEREERPDRFAKLLAQCQSGFERDVLHAIRDRGLPLPDAAQHTVYDGDEPTATTDFFYAPRLLIFVDGSPHYRDYIQAADERKRSRLDAKGYRILPITPEDVEERLDELAGRLGR